MKKETSESKEQTKENQPTPKKSSYSKKKRVEKIFLTELHMFNQHLTIQ